MTAEDEKRIAAEHAVTFVESGMKIGIGTGSTAAYFVRALGARVRAGLQVQGVPTSEATRRQCEAEGIPLLTFDDVTHLDLCVDGADEADPQLCLTKGGGGALLREKVVAHASARFVVIVDSAKLVDQLHAFPLPVEVVPFAAKVVALEIGRLGGKPNLRERDGKPYVTDNHNWILDCRFAPIDDPARLAAALDRIPGVAEHGLFVGMAQSILVGRSTADGGYKVDVIVRPEP